MVNLLLSLYNFDENWCYEKLKPIIKEDHNVLIIPFSYHEEWLSNRENWESAFDKDNGTHYKEIVSPFLAYGIEETNIKWINQFVDSEETMKQKIKTCDIIFFTGGYPDKMMERFKKYNIVGDLEKFDGIVIGASAGAMVQINEFHITKDLDYKDYSYNKGLNMIKDFDIEVHFENTEIQNISILRTINEKRKPVYSITNEGAVLVYDKNIYILGDAQLWKVPEIIFSNK